MSRRRLPRFPRISLLVLLSLALAGSGAWAQTATKPAAQDELARVNEAVDALTKKVWPSVVQILVNSYGARDSDGKGGESSVVVGRQRSVGSPSCARSDPELYGGSYQRDCPAAAGWNGCWNLPPRNRHRHIRDT